MCAFDCPSPKQRDALKKQLYDNQLIVIGCGASTIRFRPPLIISSEEIDEALSILESVVQKSI
jgi:L-lysine 6-transaminase